MSPNAEWRGVAGCQSTNKAVHMETKYALEIKLEKTSGTKDGSNLAGELDKSREGKLWSTGKTLDSPLRLLFLYFPLHHITV